MTLSVPEVVIIHRFTIDQALPTSCTPESLTIPVSVLMEAELLRCDKCPIRVGAFLSLWSGMLNGNDVILLHLLPALLPILLALLPWFVLLFILSVLIGCAAEGLMLLLSACLCDFVMLRWFRGLKWVSSTGEISSVFGNMLSFLAGIFNFLKEQDGEIN